MLGEILTAIVTPFKPDLSLDLDRFRALAAHLVDNGSDGLVVTGTTGESPTLSDEERFSLYEAAVDEVGDRATVVAGTGTYATEHSVHLTARAHEIGVDGFLVVTPYYNKPPVRGIVEHFKAIAAVSDRPLVVYNIPGRVVLNLETEAIAQLAEIPTVRAVKQANDDLDQARGIVELGLDLYAGDDDIVLPFVELGGVGGVCVHTHVVGPQVKEMVGLFRGGDVDCCSRVGREAAALDRPPSSRTEPDRDQVRAEPPRARGRRPPPPARRGERGGAGRGARLSRAPRAPPAGRRIGMARSHDLLATLVDAQTRGGLGRPQGPGIAGVTTGPGGRTWDAIAAADCPDLPGEGVTFTVLDDGTIVVSTDLPDGSLAPLAEALEATVSPPYRAAAARSEGDSGQRVAESVRILSAPGARRRGDRAERRRRASGS